MQKLEYSSKFTGCLTDSEGVQRWFINGACCREDDQPAVIHPDGSRYWYVANPKRGAPRQRAEIPHRVGGPAAIKADGTEIWYQFGELHRDEADGPAVSYPDGTKKWFAKGKCLRVELPGGAGSVATALNEIPVSASSSHSFFCVVLD